MRAVALPILLPWLLACKGTDAPPAAAPSAAKRASPPIVIKVPTTPALSAWERAEDEPTRAHWEAAADELTAEVTSCTSDCLKLAKREIKARMNALGDETYSAPEGNDPAPLDPRLARFVAAMDHYVKYADPSDHDAAGYALGAANMMSEYRHNADAIARCEAILHDYRNTDVAGDAANELLDLLQRTNQTADLRFWVNDLLADSQFLDGKDELRAALLQLSKRLDSSG